MATKLGSQGMPESDNEGKGHFGNNLLIGFGLLLFFFFFHIDHTLLTRYAVRLVCSEDLFIYIFELYLGF